MQGGLPASGGRESRDADWATVAKNTSFFFKKKENICKQALHTFPLNLHQLL
jgi:hypothetical protein